MTAPAAISGSFADYRLVKSRSVLQLVIEIPIERQAEAFAVLGFPMPGEEIHCALARLIPASPEPAEERPGSSLIQSDETGASRRGKEHYRELPPERQALIRAGRLPRSDQFREWLASLWGVSMISEERAEEYIRNRCCNGGSRRQIAEDLACREAFLTLETDYYAATGQMAEVR